MNCDELQLFDIVERPEHDALFGMIEPIRYVVEDYPHGRRLVQRGKYGDYITCMPMPDDMSGFRKVWP